MECVVRLLLVQSKKLLLTSLLVGARPISSWGLETNLKPFIVRGQHNLVSLSIAVGIAGLKTNTTKRNEGTPNGPWMGRTIEPV